MSFGRTKCDLSVVSDLNTVRMPCSCMQRRRGSDPPFTWGKTAVDLNCVTDSLLGGGGGVSWFRNLLYKGGGTTV